jgi:hypothetical protein
MQRGYHLKTLKKAQSETGASISFLKQLIREGKLKKYYINSAVYISLQEFESLAKPA